MSKWISCNGILALIALPNDFLIIFLARQCSQVGISNLSNEPNRPYRDSLFILLSSIWPSLACQTFTSTFSKVDEAIMKKLPTCL